MTDYFGLGTWTCCTFGVEKSEDFEKSWNGSQILEIPLHPRKRPLSNLPFNRCGASAIEHCWQKNVAFRLTFDVNASNSVDFSAGLLFDCHQIVRFKKPNYPVSTVLFNWTASGQIVACFFSLGLTHGRRPNWVFFGETVGREKIRCWERPVVFSIELLLIKKWRVNDE